MKLFQKHPIFTKSKQDFRGGTFDLMPSYDNQPTIIVVVFEDPMEIYKVGLTKDKSR